MHNSCLQLDGWPNYMPGIITADDCSAGNKACAELQHVLFAGYIAYTYLRCAAVQATQHARETLEAVAAQGKLGKAGRGGKVIYAQTDSIFASFPNATTEEAIQVCCIISASSHLCLKSWAGLGWAGLGWAGLGWAALRCAALCCAVLCWAGLGCAVLGCDAKLWGAEQLTFTSCRTSHSQKLC